MDMGGGGGAVVEPLETPVVAFPLRGRLNPYFWYLLPLIFISLFAYVREYLNMFARLFSVVSYIQVT